MSERNNRDNVLFMKIVIVCIRIMMSITAEIMNVHVQSILLCSFLESIQGVKRKSKVTFVSAGQSDMKREIMAIFGDSQNVVPVAKDKVIVMVVKAPLSSVACVMTRMVTFIDTLAAA